jgi:hypothetical protein
MMDTQKVSIWAVLRYIENENFLDRLGTDDHILCTVGKWPVQVRTLLGLSKRQTL